MAIISWEVDIFKKKEKTFSFRHIRLLAEKQQPNFLIATSNGALTKLIYTIETPRNNRAVFLRRK